MIYSDAFTALPDMAKQFVYRRLREVLAGRDGSADFQALSGEDRRAILEILLATKTDLPADWQRE
jgi:hypothetical protein